MKNWEPSKKEQGEHEERMHKNYLREFGGAKNNPNLKHEKKESKSQEKKEHMAKKMKDLNAGFRKHEKERKIRESKPEYRKWRSENSTD